MNRNKIPKNRIRKLRTLALGTKSYEFQYLTNDFHKDLIDLCSNDYFGLSRDPEIIEAAHQITLKEGLGSGSSRFISGSRPIHKLLEFEIGRWLDQENVLLFPSGYQANIAAMQALSDRQTIVIADKLIHNSLLIGARASGSKLKRFLHNNLVDLEKKLCKYSKDKNPILVVVESIYSMEGTIAPLGKIVEICNKYDCKLLVDEAHAFGILGPKGKGLSFNFKDKITMISGTFGKAFGSGGAFLACNSKVGENLIQASDPFRYTTALSPSLAAGALKSLHKIQDNKNLRKDLLKISRKWKNEINKIQDVIIKGDAHILSLIIGEENKTMMLQKYLEDKGFLAIGIRPPTVPVGQSRIRITMRSSLNNEILTNFIDALRSYI